MNTERPNLVKNTLLILLLVMFTTNANAQDPGSGIVFGVKGGTSKMLGEANSLFAERVNDFNQKVGWAGDMELSKLFLNHFEAGLEVGITKLSGILEDPTQSYSKYKLQQGHYYIRDLPGPLKYSNHLITQKFFIGYYFRSFSKIKNTFSPEPFFRAGAGYITYGVELFSKNESTSGKGTDNYADLNMSSALFFASVGIKTYISHNFSMNVSYTFNYTNYDYLDAVFNYDSNEQRLGLKGMYSEIKVGLFFQFLNNISGKGSSRRGHGASLPFSR